MSIVINALSPRDKEAATEQADLLEAVLDATTESQAIGLPSARHVSASDIEAAFHTTQMLLSSSGSSLAETTLLLLKSGIAYLNLVSSPLDLRVPDAVESDSGWTHWRMGDDGRHEIQNLSTGEWSAIDGTQIDRNPGIVDDVAATYSRTSAYTVGSTTIVTHTDVVLDASGNFEQRGSRTASFSTFSHTGGTYTRSAHSSWSSAETAINENPDVPRIDQWAMLEDGLTLQLTHGDGEVSRRLAYMLGNRFVLDGTSYSRTSSDTRVSSLADLVDARDASGRSVSWLSDREESEDDKRQSSKRGAHLLGPAELALEAERAGQHGGK